MKFKVAKLYKIRFWDHTIGSKATAQCQVVGWCIDDNKTRVLLSHWIIVECGEDVDMVENNYEYTSIIKSTIIWKKVMR